MMRHLAIIILAMTIFSLPISPAAADSNPGDISQTDYILGAGDVLEISLWQSSELTKTVVILPDDTISFPLIGKVTAGGKTVEGLKKELKQKISRFVPDPNLSVSVQQVNSMFIYVIGRVNNPGRFLMNGNIDVLQALATAGGLNPFARKNSIRILRKQGSETTAYEFEYGDVAKGRNLEQNIMLQRGDVIIVP